LTGMTTPGMPRARKGMLGPSIKSAGMVRSR
jgi:hypothetical protein